MISEIGPALAAEQWSGRYGPCLAPADNDRAVGLNEYGNLVVFTGHRDWFDGQERHALAALALLDQPYGFTQADVELLARTVSNQAVHMRDCAAGGPVLPGDISALHGLLARIAALLPPTDL